MSNNGNSANKASNGSNGSNGSIATSASNANKKLYEKTVLAVEAKSNDELQAYLKKILPDEDYTAATHEKLVDAVLINTKDEQIHEFLGGEDGDWYLGTTRGGRRRRRHARKTHRRRHSKRHTNKKSRKNRKH
jgi:hypothetical protein